VQGALPLPSATKNLFEKKGLGTPKTFENDWLGF
jgi:hypothetical protein